MQALWLAGGRVWQRNPCRIQNPSMPRWSLAIHTGGTAPTRRMLTGQVAALLPGGRWAATLAGHVDQLCVLLHAQPCSAPGRAAPPCCPSEDVHLACSPFCWADNRRRRSPAEAGHPRVCTDLVLVWQPCWPPCPHGGVGLVPGVALKVVPVDAGARKEPLRHRRRTVGAVQVQPWANHDCVLSQPAAQQMAVMVKAQAALQDVAADQQHLARV